MQDPMPAAKRFLEGNAMRAVLGLRNACLVAAVCSWAAILGSNAKADLMFGTGANALPGGLLVTAGYNAWVASCATGNGNCTLFFDDPLVPNVGPANLSPDTVTTFLNDNAGFGAVTGGVNLATNVAAGSPEAVVNTGLTAYSIWGIHNDFLVFGGAVRESHK